MGDTWHEESHVGDTWHVRAMCQAHRKKVDERRNLILVLAVERNKEKKEKKESERKRKEKKKLVVISLIFAVPTIGTR